MARVFGISTPSSRRGNRHNAALNIPLNSRFSQRFGLGCPIALAPMALAAGGALAAACARAGALGLVGGGYGELAWTQREFTLAQSATDTGGRIGCGFIVWKLDSDCSALDWVLEQKPRAIMLSSSAEEARAEFDAGVKADDFSRAHATVGEAAGLIHDLPPAAQVIERMSAGAAQILGGR